MSSVAAAAVLLALANVSTAAADESAAGTTETGPPQPLETVADWARGAQIFVDLGSLHRKITEISMSFRAVPYSVFRGTDAVPLGRDALVIRVQPNEGISLHLNIKKPGLGFALDRAELDFDYQSAYRTPLIEAYETLLLEAMAGDHTLFTRADEVERGWEVISPVIERSVVWTRLRIASSLARAP